MELKLYIYMLADVILIASSLIYGIKFLRKRNYLMGGELLVVTFSAANLLMNALTDETRYLNISLFCDSFSRIFGIPVITIAGLMAVTHGYKPSKRTDITFFVIGIAVTVLLWNADFMIAPKPYLYLALWTLFSVYLAYFAKRLAAVGERFQAVLVLLALVATQAISTIYDFYPIPGDEHHVIFYIFALLAWSYLSMTLYYAYCALERAREKESRLIRPYVFSGQERHL